MAIRFDGPITTGTVASLVEGVRSSPMAPAAVDAVLEQVAVFAQQLVDIYSAQIAPGEVGESGTGQASEDRILANRPPRALLFGRVQSGKTVSMILTSALCLDNGFRVVVVLTTDNVALVRQTAARFKDLDGPRVFAAIKETGQAFEWEGQEDELRESIASEGLVLVCSKNGFRLPEVISFLQNVSAAEYPLLVLDDEADAATPDTTAAARTSGATNAPPYASKINRLVTGNDRPGEIGLSLTEQLPHSLYVQVTATPYVLLLQRQSAELRPTTTFLLDAGAGYCGGEVFFGEVNGEPGGDQPTTLVLVGANEGAAMRRVAPTGLAKSINFFMLSACALSIARDGKWPREGFKHLSHTSHLTTDHEIVAGYIHEHLNVLRKKIRAGNGTLRGYFEEAYVELQRSLNPAPSLDDLLRIIRSASRNAEVIRINSISGEADYSPRLNFLVGGNILGRGLTIDDLLVTYYVREAKTSQMDTVWQHARMFGYRQSYLPYIRIYLPLRLAARFQQIHLAEEGLRQQLAKGDAADLVLIRVPTASRPTRPNALEAGAVRSVEAGRDQIFPYFLAKDTGAASIVLNLLRTNGVPINSSSEERATKVPLAAAQAMIDAVLIQDDDGGLWDASAILALLDNYGEQLAGEMTVYVRHLETEPPSQGWIRGRLAGREITTLQEASPAAPSLALLYYGNDMSNPEAWYPTLVMPKSSPAFVFSAE